MIETEQILRDPGLRIGRLYFSCPYCGRDWLRGGHKEGFVKSAATNHVAGCKEIVLFQAGYVMGPVWGTVIPVQEAASLPHWPRWRRAILALIARRKRMRLTPRRPAWR